MMDSHSSGNSAATIINEGCKAAEKFCNLYYENLDKQRHKIGMFYLDDASMVWNGNGVKGVEAITKFYESLPGSSTEITSLDAQPVIGFGVKGKPSLLVQVSGRCEFSKKPPTPFCQTFHLIVKEDTATWKISCDTLRLSK